MYHWRKGFRDQSRSFEKENQGTIAARKTGAPTAAATAQTQTSQPRRLHGQEMSHFVLLTIPGTSCKFLTAFKQCSLQTQVGGKSLAWVLFCDKERKVGEVWQT
jgi:hypothetical protein